ncbi:MAG: hypothetical protein GXX96_16980 [Planctomycetaceae bacterium]|nr:hypothetical protein [Planctomycetaceae bacterium]
MPARIVIQRGQNSSEQFWIEEEVTRIGSAADCTFVVQGIPSHCITLLYRKGQYSVVNRSSATIEVAGEPLLPTADLPIRRGERVSVGSDTTLQLEIEGDPAPSRRSTLATPHSANKQHETSVEPESTGKLTGTQMAILGAGVLAAAYLLLGNPMGAETARSQATSAEFGSLVQHLQSNVKGNFDGPKRIRRALQRARISELRGDSSSALAEYEIVQKMVRPEDRSAGAPARYLASDLRRRLFNFAQNRTEALQ